MATDAEKILAGVAAGGAGTSLAWFDEPNTAAPATAIAALTGYEDAGYCSTDGLTAADAVTTTVIQAFGTLQAVRVLTTAEILTFKVTFLESNPISLAIYHKKALDSITVASDGSFHIDDGVAARQRYAGVFDIVDGDNHIRVWCPLLEVTDKDDLQISAGNPVEYGVTFTAYPNSADVAVRWMYIVDALASS